MIDSRSWLGRNKLEIETPSLLLDLEILERNLAAMQALCSRGGVQYRPHTKTHKSPLLALLQIERGAGGICCAKLAEVEVMGSN